MVREAFDRVVPLAPAPADDDDGEEEDEGENEWRELLGEVPADPPEPREAAEVVAWARASMKRYASSRVSNPSR